MEFVDKLHLALTILSAAILVVPLAGIVCFYSGNLTGLVYTPELKNLVNGDISESQFQRPVPAGNPTYDEATGVYTFSFKFTNPLDNEISVSKISADVYCKEHKVALGAVSIDKSITIQPGETVIIDASGTWTTQALAHFATIHTGPDDDDINVSFRNLKVDLAGIQIYVAELEDAGWVMMPR
jgi:hypothetical protein